MIHFKNVSKQYYSDLALDNVTFSIEKGDFVFLIGPTGSGKTTIFRLIIRDLLPSEGVIEIGDINVNKLPGKKIRQLRRNVGVVFQDLKLLTDRTVGENVMLPLQFSGVSEKDAKIRAEEVLTSVGLESAFSKFPLQLSGGERQRVAIARALVFDPEVILADEPTGNLDFETSRQILDLLESINKQGTTIFMATHNDRIIDSTKKRVIVLEKGKLKDDRRSREEKKHVSHEESSSKTHEKNAEEKNVEVKAHEAKHEKEEIKKEDKNEKSEDKISLESIADK
ncbi:MAG: ATP-binding cassette domain-containing protein [Candidatus Levybacteria bacterium]|nr:ATP-binding cassette domain-containing protein [Candidatus Levybacteria bacterium]